MDQEEISSELIRRYEEMLRSGERRYFDAEDIEDIAYEYELSEQYQAALDVIEYGLQLHPWQSRVVGASGRLSAVS